MRTLMLGMLLAAGAALPTMAIAQEEGHRPDNPRKWAGGQEEPRPEGGRPHNAPRAEQPQPQPQPRPQPAPPPAAPVQAQARAEAQVQARGGPGGGGFRGDGGARFNGDPRRFDRGDRFDQGNRPPPPGAAQGYRPQGGSPGAPGAGDRRVEGAAPYGQGQGGYRAQGAGQYPGPGGYRQQGNPPIAPGAGGYRAQGGPGYRPAPPPPGPRGAWNRGWRDNRQFNYNQYRVQNNYIYHLPRYYAPSGWGYGYRRFSPGITLSTVLFAQDYWIDDPYYYRLPPAYGPYRWVRYYNDALLIDVRSGVVVDVVHDIFW